MTIRIALPKGRLLEETASLLNAAGWGLSGYTRSMRNYRLRSSSFPELQARVFNERDIPIQVAVGNYDLGICGLDWVEELSVRYASSTLVKIRDLGYGQGTLYLAASQAGPVATVDQLTSETGPVRIASEYPNLAEFMALSLRLRRFNILPLWGAAEAYPPESAALALVSRSTEQELAHSGLGAVARLMDHSAFLIANRASWEHKDLSWILESIDGKVPAAQQAASHAKTTASAGSGLSVWDAHEDTVRLALPDGHQQAATVGLLQRAGISIEDYPSQTDNRRPRAKMDGLVIKVIRPQDMPLQVASDNFDLAITGRDWLTDHLTMFPSSPVAELVDLKTSRVRMVAVVSRDVPADDIFALRQLVSSRESPFRVASEYVNIADKYARDNHLGMYRIIPTWGATEAFVPEDADLLIENTETGRTIARHNLKIIDTLFESTGCLIGSKEAVSRPIKRQRIGAIVEALRTAVASD